MLNMHKQKLPLVPLALRKPCIFLGKGNKAVTNWLKFAEIRDSEGQKEPALQLLEISLRSRARGFESLSLRQIRPQFSRIAVLILHYKQFDK